MYVHMYIYIYALYPLMFLTTSVCFSEQLLEIVELFMNFKLTQIPVAISYQQFLIIMVYFFFRILIYSFSTQREIHHTICSVLHIFESGY